MGELFQCSDWKADFHPRNTVHAYKVTVHTIRHSAPCSIATNVFFQFSHLKNVGSIIALAAGCAQRLEFTGKRCSSIFVGISSPPQDTRGRVLHSVRSILLLPSCQPGECVRACTANECACLLDYWILSSETLYVHIFYTTFVV